MKQTALQELLQWVRATLPMDLDTPRMIEEKIESLLPMEKEQMNEIHLDGIEQGYNMRYEQEKKMKHGKDV